MTAAGSAAAGDGPLLAGIDVGGTGTKVVLTDDRLRVLARTEVPTPAHDGGAVVVGRALDAVRDLTARVDGGPRRLAGIGVGAAGVVDSASGTVLVTGDSFTGWAGFGVTAAIEAELGVPATLDNDVNAFLRGEVAAGAVRGAPDVLGVMLGTGVGGALVIDGRPYDGPGGAAGEIGHVPGFGDARCTCGQTGHLETIASGRSIASRYAARTGRMRSAAEVAGRADTGDPDAVAVLADAGRGVARAILITAGLIDVATVVVGGGVARAWRHLAPAMEADLAAEPPVSGRVVRVERSTLGADAVALGAVSRVRSAALAPEVAARP